MMDLLGNLVFWDRHLMTILATKIFMAAIPAATYQVSAVGATALIDTNDGLRGVTKSEISFLMDSLGQTVLQQSAAHEELY